MKWADKNPRAHYYMSQYGLTMKQFRKKNVSIAQLDRCNDDEARRLLLRISSEVIDDNTGNSGTGNETTETAEHRNALVGGGDSA